MHVSILPVKLVVCVLVALWFATPCVQGAPRHLGEVVDKRSLSFSMFAGLKARVPPPIPWVRPIFPNSRPSTRPGTPNSIISSGSGAGSDIRPSGPPPLTVGTLGEDVAKMWNRPDWQGPRPIPDAEASGYGIARQSTSGDFKDIWEVKTPNYNRGVDELMEIKVKPGTVGDDPSVTLHQAWNDLDTTPAATKLSQAQLTIAAWNTGTDGVSPSYIRRVTFESIENESPTRQLIQAAGNRLPPDVRKVRVDTTDAVQRDVFNGFMGSPQGQNVEEMAEGWIGKKVNAVGFDVDSKSLDFYLDLYPQP